MRRDAPGSPCLGSRSRLRGEVVVTSVEGPTGGINHDGERADGPGWALPTPGPWPPLTEVQREVIEEIAEAQHEHGKADKWRRAFKWDLLGGTFGALMRPIDAFLASRAQMRARDAEREAQFLAESSVPKTVADPVDDGEPRALAGGPPTREEVYEAEMHPWRHHGMAETIEHNRGLRNDPGDAQPRSEPPDTREH